MSDSKRQLKPDRPQVLSTDKYEIRVYDKSRKIYFHRLDIKLGQVVPRKSPQFILDMKEYQHYPDVLDTIKAWIEAWTGKTILFPPETRKRIREYQGDGREYITQGKIT